MGNQPSVKSRIAMHCPLCQHSASTVLRTTHKADSVLRVRCCSRCGNRWTTEEVEAGTVQRARMVQEQVKAVVGVVV